MRAALRAGRHLLLGTDLVKDPAVLVPAYDDAAGVTAEFNRNVLRVINRELAPTSTRTRSRTWRVWDPEQEWIEMRLRARRPMRVRLGALDLTVDFAADEELRTEVSAKFRPGGNRGGVGGGRLPAGAVLDRPGRPVRGDAGPGGLTPRGCSGSARPALVRRPPGCPGDGVHPDTPVGGTVG